jgi:hypothetical protein
MSSGNANFDLTSRILITQGNYDTNEYEASFNYLNSDVYNGHRVVAMPHLGGKSVREVVSSREPPPVSASRRTATPTQRSSSVGRASSSKARDLIQDVYDRMGVSRENLRSNAEISTDSRVGSRYPRVVTTNHMNINDTDVSPLPQQPPNQPPSTRGRGMDATTDGQRRARSLSRGRSVAGRWPPTRDQDEQEMRAARDLNTERNVVMTSQSTDGRTSDMPQSIWRQHHPSSSQAVTATSSASPQPMIKPVISTMTSSSTTTTALASTHEDGTTTRLGHRVSTSDSIPMKIPAFRKVEQSNLTFDESGSEGANSSLMQSNSLSVKDRVSALGGTNGKSNRNFRKPTIPVSYMKRGPPPPKIDIYQDGRKQIEEDHGKNKEGRILETYVLDHPVESSETNTSENEEVAKAQASVPSSQLGRAGQYSWRSSGANLHVPRTKSPPREINGAEDSGMIHDASSVALSSVSADEFPECPPVATINAPAIKKDPGNRRWNGGVAAQHRSLPSAVKTPLTKPVDTNGGSNLQVDQIERLVEERLQSYIKDFEANFRSEVTRLENRLEAEMQNRMDQLEFKMDKIGEMLSSILADRLDED